MVEQDYNGEYYVYERSILPNVTRKSKNHRVVAMADSWCFTIRGPWQKTWTEDSKKETITFTHGRKVVKTSRKWLS